MKGLGKNGSRHWNKVRRNGSSGMGFISVCLLFSLFLSLFSPNSRSLSLYLPHSREKKLIKRGSLLDTYSEHYRDLHSFLGQTPNLLSSSSPSNLASVSFFHGLGATSRSFYDVYTQVVTLHLLEFGLKTEWSQVEVLGEGEGDVWEKTGWRDEGEGGKGERKKYWEWEKAVGEYRLPVCRLEY